MIRNLWRQLEAFLPGNGRRRALRLAIESLIAGLLEATVLVLVVSAALAVSDGRETIGLHLPLAGNAKFGVTASLGGAALAGILMLVIHLQIAQLMARLSADVMQMVRVRAIGAFGGATWSRQERDREGSLQEAASTLAGQSSVLLVKLCEFVSASLGLLALFATALLVNPLATVFVLLFGTTIFVALRPIGSLTQRRSQEFVRSNSEFTESMSQWATMAMELRVFGVEEVEAQRLLAHNGHTSGALARTRFMSRAGADLYKDLAVLFLVGAVAGLHLTGDVNLAAVGAVVILIVRSLSYAQQTNSALQQMHELRPNLESLLARLGSLEAEPEPVGSLPLSEIGIVEFLDVGYEYASGRLGVGRISLELAAGEAIGVIGPSGGGKTTLVQLLTRLRSPTSGTIRVASLPYDQIDASSWHQLVTLVPQEPRMCEGTVAENIAFLRKGITRADIEHAARLAHVLEDILALPSGFDTLLGPRGIGLSGGQKQRIAIARALVGNPKLLVLDEPTSALDVHSEQLLQRTIRDLKGRVTLVIVAHRLSTLACCDRVVAIANGRVQTIGTLEEALAVVSFDPNVTQVAPPTNRIH